jgi:hypothetical protein
MTEGNGLSYQVAVPRDKDGKLDIEKFVSICLKNHRRLLGELCVQNAVKMRHDGISNAQIDDFVEIYLDDIPSQMKKYESQLREEVIHVFFGTKDQAG